DAAPASRGVKFQLGLASYSFRKFNVDQVVKWCKKADITQISLKDFHLALKSTDEECAAMAKKFQDAGMNVYSCGVIYMSKEEDVENAFRYAKALGCVSIVGVPEWSLLPLVEKKVQETGILMAIHNHGPGDKRYPRAASVWERVKDMDPGICIALDIGHSVRDGEDPVQAVRDYAPRIFDFHFKDMHKAAADGHGVICGRGVLDLPGLVEALVEIGYDKVAPFEYEIDDNDPFPGFMESLGYVRGLCAMYARKNDGAPT
ncbi:MAG: sugar phosphate isomerase/epimerase, partial [Thermoguttaceae bacterium]|nr:sugar phosphate isomerase/epimerase [Thermoguttaceae bacterium]